MLKDERDLLDVLKFELRFLEDGGYRRSPQTPWRPHYIFEDSPTCMNFNCKKEDRSPCSDCVLMHLVPPQCRLEKIPCRHIPLDAAGETLDTLYRYCDQNEIEQAVGSWLRTTIRGLEEEREATKRDRCRLLSRVCTNLEGTPLYQKQHPKCANPGWPTAFHWTGGGKFFRFRPEFKPAAGEDSDADAPSGIHGVRHYWLCECCSQAFTLVYDPQYGVVLKALWPEFPVTTQSKKELSAA